MALEGIEPGTIVAGRYRVLHAIGKGGMGTVYAAENLVTQKQVALKCLHPQAALASDAAQRFLREAQVASKLRHPNVVDVYDIIHDEQRVFIIMELLRGETLSDLLQRGGAPIPGLIALLLRAMRGVASAHKQGIIHRDVKPDNIFLARDVEGTVTPKVLDFGVAKICGVGELAHTSTGIPIGTPLYMSLEQLKGQKDIDARADIYAFGVILYEAVTGHKPYPASSFTELTIQIATTEPPPPKALKSSIPSALSRVIQWAMAKEREDRIASLELLIRELEPLADERAFRELMTNVAAAMPRVPGPPPGTILATARTQTQQTQSTQRTYGTPAYVRAAPITGAPPTEIRTQSGASRNRLWIAGAVALACVGLGVSFAWLSAAPGAQPVPPPVAGSPAPTPPPPVRQVMIRSEPAGASVVRDGAILGATPMSIPVEPAGSLELRLANYTTVTVRVDAYSQNELVARLELVPTTPVKPAQKAPPSLTPVAPVVKKLCGPAPWQPLPMPGGSILGGIFNAGARNRRAAMLTSGPPCRSLADAKQALAERLIDKTTYDDNVWVLRTWRERMNETASAQLKSGVIDSAEYNRRVAANNARVEGSPMR